MTRQERDKLSQRDWPRLNDIQLQELIDFKQETYNEVLAQLEAPNSDRTDFGLNGAAYSLRHDLEKLKQIRGERRTNGR